MPSISRKILRAWRHEGISGLFSRLLHRKSARLAFGGTPGVMLPLQLVRTGHIPPDLALALAEPPLAGLFHPGAGTGTRLHVDPDAGAGGADLHPPVFLFTSPARFRDFLGPSQAIRPGGGPADAMFLVASEDCIRLAAGAGISAAQVLLVPATEGAEALRAGLIRWLIAARAIPAEADPAWFPQLSKLEPGARLCLSLPEASARHARFRALGLDDFRLFPGLRLEPGWQGAAASYALIARAALAQDAVPLTICEDDLIPGPEFRARLAAIEARLGASGDWDVFSGLLTNLSDAARVVKVTELDGQKLVQLDFTTGMVFNIYGPRALAHLAAWRPDRGGVEGNTIDDWLGQMPGLRVVTTLPFLVGHDAGQRSTIFGFSNQRYAPVIEGSARRLGQLVDDFEAGEGRQG